MRRLQCACPRERDRGNAEKMRVARLGVGADEARESPRAKPDQPGDQPDRPDKAARGLAGLSGQNPRLDAGDDGEKPANACKCERGEVWATFPAETLLRSLGSLRATEPRRPHFRHGAWQDRLTASVWLAK
jgi:hypothetical protein